MLFQQQRSAKPVSGHECSLHDCFVLPTLKFGVYTAALHMERGRETRSGWWGSTEDLQGISRSVACLLLCSALIRVDETGNGEHKGWKPGACKDMCQHSPSGTISLCNWPSSIGSACIPVLDGGSLLQLVTRRTNGLVQVAERACFGVANQNLLDQVYC